jgi:hypothetical protein
LKPLPRRATGVRSAVVKTTSSGRFLSTLARPERTAEEERNAMVAAVRGVG